MAHAQHSLLHIKSSDALCDLQVEAVQGGACSISQLIDNAFCHLQDEAVLGGACSISQLINVLREDPKLEAWQVISDHLLRIAGQSTLHEHQADNDLANEKTWLCWCTSCLKH